jgi:hypothetical protein
MARPGDTVIVPFRVRNISTDAFVSGLTIANFSYLFVGSSGTALSITPSITAVSGSSGYYRFSYTQPSAGYVAWWLVTSSSSYAVEFGDGYSEIEAHDFDSVTEAARLQSAIVRSDGTILTELDIRRVAGDTYDITFRVNDSDGNAIDVATDYNTHRVGISDSSHSVNVTYSGAAVVASDTNLITVTVGASDAWQSAGSYYIDFDCVKISTSKIHTLARGALTVLRQEAGYA